MRKDIDFNTILVKHNIPAGDTEVEVSVLEFPMLKQCNLIKHCFSTRLGGVSEGDCATMNLSFSRGDDPEAVLENYRRIAGVLGETVEHMVASDQTHTTNVRRCTSADWGKGITEKKDYTDVDGLISNEPGVVLATFYADCVPLYFVDPVHKAIGLSHSGWRGTVERMGQKTLEAMRDAYGTDPKDVLSVIGPSICQDCYEISEDVAEHFMREFANHRDEILIDRGQGKYQLDLWKTNEIVLREAGVLPENMEVSGICTCCNHKLLFSHRASCGRRGNLGAFLVLK